LGLAKASIKSFSNLIAKSFGVSNSGFIIFLLPRGTLVDFLIASTALGCSFFSKSLEDRISTNLFNSFRNSDAWEEDKRFIISSILLALSTPIFFNFNLIKNML
jgi:hypothetical protein